MSSMKPSDAAASRSASGLDPVHPAPRPEPVADEAPVASSLGVPAALDHHVVALEVGTGPRPLIVHMVGGTRGVMPLAVQVWARAGRMTVVLEDGSELKLTVLCPDECRDARLGEHWPAGEPESRAKRVAAAAVRDVGEVLTFPAWLARTTKLSGRRNAALQGLVRKLRTASPGTAVYVGQTYGFEHHHAEHHHPYDHRGIIGKEGYPKQL